MGGRLTAAHKRVDRIESDGEMLLVKQLQEAVPKNLSWDGLFFHILK